MPDPALAREVKAFRSHLTVYLIVNAGLVGINLLAGPAGEWWARYPAMGWGIGLLIHAFTTFVSPGPTAPKPAPALPAPESEGDAWTPAGDPLADRAEALLAREKQAR